MSTSKMKSLPDSNATASPIPPGGDDFGQEIERFGKHRIRLLLSLLGGLIFLSYSNEADSSVAVLAVQGSPGRAADLPVLVMPASNVVAAQFDVTFDPTRISIIGALGPVDRSGQVVRWRELSPGVLRVLVYSPMGIPVAANSRLAELRFLLAEDERIGSGPIRPQNLRVINPHAVAVGPLTSRSGRIYITSVAPPDESGTSGILFAAQSGSEYTLLASEDLIEWIPISTQVALGDFVEFLDYDAGRFAQRFYAASLTNGGVTAMLRVDLIPSIPPEIQIYARGIPGHAYLVEASVDLNRWELVSEFEPGDEDFTRVLELSSTLNAQRFYRLRPADSQ